MNVNKLSGVLAALLLVSLFAMQPVAAADFSKVPIEASAGSWLHNHYVGLIGGGLIIVGVITGQPEVVYAGGALVLGDLGYNAMKGNKNSNSSSSNSVILTSSFSINVTPETSVFSSYTPVDSNSVDQEAQSDVNTLMVKLSPSFTSYELLKEGDNQFQSAVLVGPNKLYGPMVFPITFIYQANGNTEVKQTNVVTQIVIEVIDANNSTADKIVISTSIEATPGQTLSLTEVVKAPDYHESWINSLISGQVGTWINSLTQSAAIQPYFIRIQLYGYAEEYYWDDSASTWKLDTTVPFSITWSADKLDQYEQPGFYVFTGFNTMFPAYLQTDARAYSFYAYQVTELGAMGDAVGRLWGQGIALYNQNWAYRAYIEANTPIFAPIQSNVSVGDEARILVLRVYTDGHREIAFIQPLSSPATLGDLLNYAKKVEGNVYLSSDSNETGIVNYEVLVAVRGHVVYNSSTKTFWILMKPNVIVQDGVMILNSEVFSSIAPLVTDGTINSSERSVIDSDIDNAIAGLQNKIQAASAVYEQASRMSNSTAMQYAQAAINYYSSAINVLQQAKVGDAKVVQNNLVQARLYEEAGDQALKAAQLAIAGNYDEAAQLMQGAQQNAQKASGVNPIAGINAGGILAWIKAHLWLIIIVIVGLIALKIIMGSIL